MKSGASRCMLNDHEEAIAFKGFIARNSSDSFLNVLRCSTPTGLSVMNKIGILKEGVVVL